MAAGYLLSMLNYQRPVMRFELELRNGCGYGGVSDAQGRSFVADSAASRYGCNGIGISPEYPRSPCAVSNFFVILPTSFAMNLSFATASIPTLRIPSFMTFMLRFMFVFNCKATSRRLRFVGEVADSMLLMLSVSESTSATSCPM